MRPELVLPGRPDQSRLYLMMLTRHMPFDVFQARTKKSEPTARDLAAVRAWIRGLEPTGRCQTAAGETGRGDGDRVGAWLADQPGGSARHLRFVSLSHLVPPCRRQLRHFEQHRAGVRKLFNALSWQARSGEAVRQIDERGDIFAVDLEMLGWSEAQWEELADTMLSALPERLRPVPALRVLEATDTAMPIVRADQLADVVSRPAVYAALLGLPQTRRVFEALLAWRGRDEAGSTTVLADVAERSGSVGIARSGYTGAPRLIHRQALGPGRYAWWAFDPSAPRTSLGALASSLKDGQSPPTVNGSARVLFRLPNGFLGATAFNADGARVALAELPAGRGAAEADRVGLACLSCHAGGLIPFKPTRTGPGDNPSPRKEATAADQQGARSAGPWLSKADVRTALSDDRFDHAAALSEAGIEAPDAKQRFDEIAALVRAYRAPLDLGRAAAELGMERQELAGRLRARMPTQAEPDRLDVLSMRLLTGLLSRDEFIEFARGRELSARAVRATPAPSIPSDADAGGSPLGLTLWSDKASYRRGDAAVFSAHTDRDCHLTLISVDARGRATILFPNDFDRDNLLKAGQAVRVPAADAPFQITLDRAGAEHVVGVCMLGDRRFLPGILKDYERQRFTLLGDWENHLAAYLDADAQERDSVGKKRKRRRRWGRRRARPPRRDSKDPLPQLRAAITVKVE